MEEEELPEGFVIESMPEAPVAQAEPSDDELPEGFELDAQTQAATSPEENTWSWDDAAEGIGLDASKIPTSRMTLANMAGRITNIPKGLATTGAAAIDYVTGTEYAPEVKQYMDELYPTFKVRPEREGIVTDVQQGMGDLAVGGGAAIKVANVGLKALEAAGPTIAKIAARYAPAARTVAAEAGYATVTNPETDLFFETLAQDPEGNYSEELLKKRLNIFTEAMVFTKAGELAARGAGAVGTFAKDVLIDPMRSLGGGEVAKKRIAKDIADVIINAKPDDTPMDVARKMNEIASKAEKGAKETIETSIPGVDDVTLGRTTMDAIKSQTPEDALYDRAILGDLQQGQLSRNSPKLEAKLDQPKQATGKFIEQNRQVAGGDESLESGFTGIQDNLQRQSDEALGNIHSIEAAQATNQAEITDLIKSDPDLGSKITELGDKVDILGLKRINNAQSVQVVSDIQRASDKMTDQKNKLYRSIPYNAEVNVPEVKATYNTIKELLPSNIRNQIEGEGDTVLARFRDWNEIVNFSDWSNHVNSLKRANKWEEVEALNAFKNYVTDDQLDYLLKSGKKATVDAATRAKKYYSEEYAPFWRDNKTLEAIQKYGRDYRNRPMTNAVTSRQKLEGTVVDDNQMEFTDNIAELLKRPEAGGNAKQLADLGIGRIAQKAQRMINSSKNGILSEQQVLSLMDEADRYAIMFDAVDPAQVTRINKFMDDLKTKSFTKEELATKLKEATTAFDASQKRLTDSGFFRESQVSGEIVRNTEADPVFRKILSGEQAPDEVKRLITENPESLNGIRVAYQDQLKRKLFFEQPTSTSGTKLPAPLKGEEAKKLLRVGKELYKDTPEVVEATSKIISILDDMQTKGKPLEAVNFRDMEKTGRGAVDTVITMIWGTLDRMGARVRTGAGRYIASLDPQKRAMAIMDELYSNPEEFARLVREVAKDTAGSGMSQEQKNALLKTYVGGILAARGDNSPVPGELESQTEDNIQ